MGIAERKTVKCAVAAAMIGAAIAARGATLTWKGGDGDWNDENWLDSSGETVGWTAGSVAVFPETGTGTVTATGAVSIATGTSIGLGYTVDWSKVTNGAGAVSGKTLTLNGTFILTRGQTFNDDGSVASGDAYLNIGKANISGTGTLIANYRLGASGKNTCTFSGITLVSKDPDGYFFHRHYGNFSLSDVTLRFAGSDFSNYEYTESNTYGYRLNITADKNTIVDTSDYVTGVARTYTFPSSKGYNFGATTGHLIKTGIGTLQLNYDLLLTGASTVENGTLGLAADCAAPLTVAVPEDGDEDATATLKVSGTRSFTAADGVTLGNKGVLDLQDGAAATMTVAKLAIGDGATLNFDVIADKKSDLISLSGEDAATIGTGITINVNLGEEYEYGPYTLIDKVGASSVDGVTLKTTGLVEGDAAVLMIQDGALCVAVDEEAGEGSAVWVGGGTDGKWSTAANWKNEAVPDENTKSLVFGGTDNLITENDIEGLCPTNIIFKGTSGAFTLGGYSVACDFVDSRSANDQTMTLPIVSDALVVSNSAALVYLSGEQNRLSGSIGGDLVLKNFTSTTVTNIPTTVSLAGTNSLPNFTAVTSSQRYKVVGDEPTLLEIKSMSDITGVKEEIVPANLTLRLIDDEGGLWTAKWSSLTSFKVSGVLDLGKYILKIARTSNSGGTYGILGSTQIGTINTPAVEIFNSVTLSLTDIRLNFTSNNWTILNAMSSAGGIAFNDGVTFGVAGTDTETGATAGLLRIRGAMTVDTLDAFDGVTPRTFTFHQRIAADDTEGERSFTKTGAGALRFVPSGTAAATSGEFLSLSPVIVNAGSVYFGNVCASTNIQINAGARLEMVKSGCYSVSEGTDDEGNSVLVPNITTNNVTVASGGTFVVGQDAVIDFTESKLTLEAGATLEYGVDTEKRAVKAITIGTNGSVVLPESGTVKLTFTDVKKISCANPHTLISGANLTADDAAKFTCDDQTLHLSVVDGNLMVQRRIGLFLIFR